MRTNFSETEIIIFLEKKKNEIVADEMIMKAISRPNTDGDITFSEMLSAIHSIGLKQGNLEGRLDLMNELFSFFEL